MELQEALLRCNLKHELPNASLCNKCELPHCCDSGSPTNRPKNSPSTSPFCYFSQSRIKKVFEAFPFRLENLTHLVSISRLAADAHVCPPEIIQTNLHLAIQTQFLPATERSTFQPTQLSYVQQLEISCTQRINLKDGPKAEYLKKTYSRAPILPGARHNSTTHSARVYIPCSNACVQRMHHETLLSQQKKQHPREEAYKITDAPNQQCRKYH